MKTKNEMVLILALTFCLLLSSCAPQPAAALPPTPMPTSMPTLIPSITPAPIAAPTQTATPTTIPFPALSLKPGNSYFSVDGQTRFIFSRNAAAYFYEDFGTLMD